MDERTRLSRVAYRVREGPQRTCQALHNETRI